VDLAVTFVVLIVNVTDVLPAATVTEPGTVAAARLLDTAIDRPPVGAALLILIVPVADDPPLTLAGLTVRETRAGGLIVSVADWVTPLKEPEILAPIWEATAVVLIVKVAEALPAGTTTELGTVAEPVLLDKVTLTPPAPATPVKVTVPVELVPPWTVDGATDTEAS
jgi:hypothetical protein